MIDEVRPIGRVREGATPAQIIDDMHAAGATIIECMKLVRRAFGLSLAQAKDLVTAQPAWRSFVEDSAPMHDEIIDALRDDLTHD